MGGRAKVLLPGGTLGVDLSAVEEDFQEDLFIHGDPRLVAVNVNGIPEMGSLVYDLNKSNEYDGERWARLQSLTRVVKGPLGGENALAIQIGVTGGGDADCGWMIDNAAGPGMVIGRMSHTVGGPFDCGTGKCLHHQGEDEDRNPISALHITTKALFRKNDTFDGPLRFEGPSPSIGEDHDHKVPVHLTWSGGDWEWWTTSPFYTPPYGYPLPNPYGYPKPGVPTPNKPRVPSPGGRSRPAPPELPPVASAPLRMGSSSIAAEVMRVFASLAGLQLPALSFRPQNYKRGEPDAGLFQPAPTSGAKKKADNAPVVGTVSAFGAQGGTITDASGDDTGHGASGDPWTFTETPYGSRTSGKRMSRRSGGTSDGGIIYHPPETDLRDSDDYGLAPPGVTLSTFYVMCGPNAYFGAGTPELVNGTLKEGYSWGANTTTGDLEFRSHSSSQAADVGVVFTKSGQNIRWYSGRDYYGEFDHFNTANRTYDWPDTDMSVLGIITRDGLGGGAAATLGTIGGTGPTVAGQAGWMRVMDEAGVTRWTPYWD